MPAVGGLAVAVVGVLVVAVVAGAQPIRSQLLVLLLIPTQVAAVALELPTQIEKQVAVPPSLLVQNFVPIHFVMALKVLACYPPTHPLLVAADQALLAPPSRRLRRSDSIQLASDSELAEQLAHAQATLANWLIASRSRLMAHPWLARALLER